MKPPKYSIILPVYNQETHIEHLITTYTAALQNLKEPYELLLVVNGSKDRSFELAQKYSKNHKQVIAHNLEKGGWGRAVRYGLANAKGDFVCYTNSARTNIEDLITILTFAAVRDDMVVKASRIVRDSFSRKLGSVIYNLECRFLFHTPIWDVNGTPKVIPRKILKKVHLVSEDDLIDAELMARCRKLRVMTVEVSVEFTKRIEGKSTTNYESALNMYLGLLKLKKKI